MNSLSTHRLYLQPVESTGAGNALDYEIRNREFFRPWVPLRSEHWFTLEGQQQRLRSEMEESHQERSHRFFMMQRKDAATIIGDVGISNIIRGAFWSAHLGYKIDGMHQGQGLMKEALSCIIDHCFIDLRLHRVEANIMPRNERSIRLVEGLGFVREGYSEKYLSINGVWEDHVRYAKVHKVLTSPSD